MLWGFCLLSLFVDAIKVNELVFCLNFTFNHIQEFALIKAVGYFSIKNSKAA